SRRGAEIDDSGQLLTLRPFERHEVGLPDAKWMPGYSQQTGVEPCCALYLLPDGGEPLWFEVRLDVYGKRIQNEGEQYGLRVRASTEAPKITRVVGRRPLVSLFAPKLEDET